MNKIDIEDKIFRQKLRLERLEENRKNIERKFEGIEREIGELEKKLEELDKPKTVYDLKYGDKYWFVTSYNSVNSGVWLNMGIDHRIRAQRRAFLTEQECIDEIRRNDLIEKARISQKGFVADYREMRCCVSYAYDEKKLYVSINHYTSVKPELGEWSNEEDVEQFIDENRPDLEWYFGLDK